MKLFETFPSLRGSIHPRMDPSVWPLNTHYDAHGRLVVSGVALTEVADEYGTPVHVLDEHDLRHRAHVYRKALPDAEIAYPARGPGVRAVAKWASESGLAIDAGSGAELEAALGAGVDPARIILHGTPTTTGELRSALSAGVGRIVLDSYDEATSLAALLEDPLLGRRQTVLVRIIPDIDTLGRPVATAVTDRIGGFRVSTGAANAVISFVLSQDRFDLIGLACHIGSEFTDVEHYRSAVGLMVAQMAQVRDEHGVVLTELDLTGGPGITSRSEDPAHDLRELAEAVEEGLDESCAEYWFPRPRIVLEPRRDLVSRSGVSLYRVVEIKRAPGGRTFVGVDPGRGGTLDGVLCGAEYVCGAGYAVVLANRHSHAKLEQVTVAARDWESGDEVATDVYLPVDVRAGDLLAVAGTGAHRHGGVGNRTGARRPPVIVLCGGSRRVLADGSGERSEPTAQESDG